MSNDSFVFACPKCRRKLRGNQNLRGKTVPCPNCKTKLRVPASGSKTDAATAAAIKKPRSKADPSDDSLSPGKKPAAGRKAGTSHQPDRLRSSRSQVVRPSTPAATASKQALAKPPAVAPADRRTLDAAPAATPAATPVSAPSNVDIDDLASSCGADEIDFFGMEIPPPMIPAAGEVPARATLAAGNASASAEAILSQPAQPRINLADAIDEQLSGKIPKRGVRIGYRIALLTTSLFMLALPLAYVTLVALFAYGVYHYTFEVVPSLMQTRVYNPRVMIFLFLLYVTPVVMGITAIIFLIKPIFVSVVAPGKSRLRSIRRESEPQLFALVDRICEVTGAPKPSRIDVDSDVNASASFGRGFRSLFSRDLVLTIGVPLVAGLNTRQFAGVLAHEFGHFAQGASMRASYIIRSINFSFAKMVYQRDAIDELLDEAVEDSESAFGLVLMAAQLCVYVTRGVVWVFMMMGHIGSCFLMRQMEYDADQYEVHVAGTESFSSTMHALQQLGFAQHAAMIGLGDLINKAVLIDDLPKMTELMRRRLSPEQRRSIADSVFESSTGLFDSHPSPRARIAAAERIETEGMFTLERPARELFRHYDGLCRNVTQDFYRNAVGRMIDPNELEPVERHVAGLA